MTTRPLTSPSLSSLRLVIMLPLIPLLRPSSCRLASSFLCLSSPILRPKASGSEGEEHTRRKKGDECETNRSEPGDKDRTDHHSSLRFSLRTVGVLVTSLHSFVLLSVRSLTTLGFSPRSVLRVERVE